MQSFVGAGYGSMESLDGITYEQLTAVLGVGAATAQAILGFLANVGSASEAIQSYRYDETRKNIPPAGLAAQDKIEEKPRTRYSYAPT